MSHALRKKRERLRTSSLVTESFSFFTNGCGECRDMRETKRSGVSRVSARLIAQGGECRDTREIREAAFPE